jgi:alkanesulfonate monooxygenase SsuD/methylene tetrahydromethanopterin reductase-like flavin-dependent oxidoreductase (luciferase family)
MTETSVPKQRPRLGLYFDLRNPEPRRPWQDLYSSCLERVRFAEEHGLDSVWTTEHHGFADGYLPQPLVLSAAFAATTSRLRIGTAVVLAPMRNARMLAEEAAIVDILSGGRLELGLGAGYRPDEFEMFGVDRSRRLEILEERARELPRLWSEGSVTPPPIQDPVPLWMGVMGPKGARAAGRTGAGLLWIDGALLEPYLEGLDEGGHDPASARMGGLVNIFLADDPEQASEVVLGSARAVRASYRSGSGKKKLREQAFPRLQILTPADAATAIAAQIRGLPVTDVFCFERIGSGDPGLVDRHVELFCDELPGLLEVAIESDRATSR